MATHAPKLLTSLENPLIKRARALELDGAMRRREETYIAWGLHLAQAALAAGAPVAQAFLGGELQKTLEGRALLKALEAAGTPAVRVSDAVLDSVVAGASDQGILLLVRRRPCSLSALTGTQPTLLLVVHGIQDPGNLGSIVRSARGFGAAAVIVLRGSTDPYGSKAVRASMGAAFTMPLVEAAASEAIEGLRRAGVALVAADPAGGRSPGEIDLRRPTALAVGNEGAGLPVPILEAATERVRIPMAAGVESLNVHAAAVALLYETARQRAFQGLR